MVLRSRLPIIVAGLLLSATLANARDPSSQDAKTLFRHFALSACIQLGFPEIAKEAGAAAGAYVQFGSHPAEAYMATGPLAEKFLKQDYPSFSDHKLTLMKCIDFADSREITRLMAKYPPR